MFKSNDPSAAQMIPTIQQSQVPAAKVNSDVSFASSGVETTGPIGKLPEEVAFKGAETAGSMGAADMKQTSFTGTNVLEQKMNELNKTSHPQSTTASQPISPMLQAMLAKQQAGKVNTDQLASTNVLRQELEKQQANPPATSPMLQAILDKQQAAKAAQKADDPNFTGGLGTNNVKHLRGSMMVSEAKSKRAQASALRSQADRAAWEGNQGKANSLRSQASSLENQASSLEREGQRLMAEANKK